jgi:parallel beta-helix repeat protein
VRRNAFLNNRTAGVFLEMGRGPCLVQNNVMGWTRPGFAQNQRRGDGLYAHDTSGFTVSGNIIVNNADFGVFLQTVSDRSFSIFPPDITQFGVAPLRRETVSTSDITVENNLFAGNARGVINLRFDNGVQDNRSDHNFLAPAPGGALRFQLNRYRQTASPAPDNLLRVPITLQQWQTLTGNDTGSTRVTARATMTSDARPRIVVRADPKIALEFPTDARDNLPYDLEWTTP